MISILDIVDYEHIPEKKRYGDRHGTYICPVCGHDMDINYAKNCFKCFKCNSGGGILDLFGFCEIPGYDKRDYPKNSHQSKELFKKIINTLQIDTRPLQRHNYISHYSPKPNPIASVAVRDAVYSAMLQACILDETDKNSLKARGFNEFEIKKLGFKSVPQFQSKIVIKKITQMIGITDFTGIPGFYKKDGNWNFLDWMEGFFIPIRNEHGKIVALQTRMRHFSKKYLFFSSSDKTCGTSSGSPACVFGKPAETVYITEGPIKGALFYKYTRKTILSVPGVNSTSNLFEILEEWRKIGTKKIRIAYDMDWMKNSHVKKALDNLSKTLRNKGFQINYLNWNPEFKGIDDMLFHMWLSQKGIVQFTAKYKSINTLFPFINKVLKNGGKEIRIIVNQDKYSEKCLQKIQKVYNSCLVTKHANVITITV